MSQAIFSHLLSRKILWRGVVEQARNREAFFSFFPRRNRPFVFAFASPLNATALETNRFCSIFPRRPDDVTFPPLLPTYPCNYFFLRSFPLSPFFHRSRYTMIIIFIASNFSNDIFGEKYGNRRNEKTLSFKVSECEREEIFFEQFGFVECCDPGNGKIR